MSPIPNIPVIRRRSNRFLLTFPLETGKNMLPKPDATGCSVSQSNDHRKIQKQYVLWIYPMLKLLLDDLIELGRFPATPDTCNNSGLIWEILKTDMPFYSR